MAFELRPHQLKAKADLYAALRAGEKRIVMQAPVAWGKTAFAASVIMDGLKGGRRAIFSAPALSLIDQTVERFYEYGINDIGVMQASHPMTAPHRPVQVCSTQTLARRQIPDGNIVLIDEAHMQHESVYRWMNDPDWADVPFVGLTATPWARGMGRHWKHLLVASTMADMAEQGWLKKLRYFSPMQIDASEVKMVAGDYHEGQLSAASSTKTILANTVQQWMEKAHDRATIAFCVDRAHAQAMQARFIECGIPCDYIDANTDGEERKAIGKRMERGQTRVTVSVGCLIAGLDWTFVSCVLFARKTKSPMLWVQGIGRGLRLHPGQEDCILLDCAGNSHLGHPFDIHFDKLDDGSKKAKEARKKEEEKIREPKCCPKCGALRPVGIRVCPECGFTPQLQSTVVELDGDLSEIGRGGKAKKKDPVSHEDMQEWYSSLLAIQEERGYKKGWAANNLRDKFGEWPEKLNLHDAALDFPSPMVSSWVKHRIIKFAKGKSKA